MSSAQAPPPLLCSRYEPPPIRTIDGKMHDVGKQCDDPGGKKRWISAFYQCEDGSLWPVLTVERRSTTEPTGPAFDKCVGRT